MFFYFCSPGKASQVTLKQLTRACQILEDVINKFRFQNMRENIPFTAGDISHNTNKIPEAANEIKFPILHLLRKIKKRSLGNYDNDMTVVIMIKVNALCELRVAHDNSSPSFDAGLKVSKLYEVLVPVAQTKVPPATEPTDRDLLGLK